MYSDMLAVLLAIDQLLVKSLTHEHAFTLAEPAIGLFVLMTTFVSLRQLYVHLEIGMIKNKSSPGQKQCDTELILPQYFSSPMLFAYILLHLFSILACYNNVHEILPEEFKSAVLNSDDSYFVSLFSIF